MVVFSVVRLGRTNQYAQTAARSLLQDLILPRMIGLVSRCSSPRRSCNRTIADCPRPVLRLGPHCRDLSAKHQRAQQQDTYPRSLPARLVPMRAAPALFDFHAHSRQYPTIRKVLIIVYWILFIEGMSFVKTVNPFASAANTVPPPGSPVNTDLSFSRIQARGICNFKFDLCNNASLLLQ